MIYTDQRRRKMNKAVRAMFPDIQFTEGKGIPQLECYLLPRHATRIDSQDDFLGRVQEHCSRINEMGTRVPDYSKAYPVFIHSLELNGKETRQFFRVNYVSISEASMARAARYISEGKLYAVCQDICNP